MKTYILLGILAVYIPVTLAESSCEREDCGDQDAWSRTKERISRITELHEERLQDYMIRGDYSQWYLKWYTARLKWVQFFGNRFNPILEEKDECKAKRMYKDLLDDLSFLRNDFDEYDKWWFQHLRDIEIDVPKEEL